MASWKINRYRIKLSRPLAGERGFPHKGSATVEPGVYDYSEQWANGPKHGRQGNQIHRAPDECILHHPVYGMVRFNRSILMLKSVSREYVNFSGNCAFIEKQGAKFTRDQLSTVNPYKGNG